MTKYVLNSGGIPNNIEGGRRFFAEAVKDLGNNPKVLLCLFAYPRAAWEKKFEEVKQKSLYPESVDVFLELAFPDKFEDQIKESDLIYIYGGDDHLLKFWFSRFDISKIFEGKVVATNSSSSQMLAKHFWTCDWRQCFDGSGILPIKFISHYKSSYGSDDPRGPIDWDKAYEELKNYGDPALPIYALEEGDFVVFEQ